MFGGLIPALIGPTTLGQLQADWMEGVLEHGGTAGQRAAVLMEDYAFTSSTPTRP
ncbi:MAG TPA: hypothetical protein VEB22_13600 [Phycisphaerales bacterium]|nr:hypothetical protein [Phycisphaerales bacterium]